MRGLGARAYEWIARAAAVYLRRGRRAAGIYVDRSVASRDLVPGLSDIDMVAVVPDDPSGGRGEHLRLKRRWERVGRVMPLLARRLVSDVPVYEDSELRAAVASSIFTYGLGVENGAGGSAAALFGDDPPHDECELRARPGLSGVAADWRLISGPERRPIAPPRDRQQLRIAAWLELQFWWRTAFDALANPGSPWAPYTCVKMVSEPARIWLALAGERTERSREQTLRLAEPHLPEMGEAISEALELLGALPHSPDPPLARFLAHLVSLSELIATRLTKEVAPEGSTQVRLVGEADELALPGGRQPRKLLPLLDWRALCVPSLPDEALRPLSREGIPPASLIDAVRAPEAAVYPALHSHDLMVLPVSDTWRRGILRAVQTRLTDPVSFAQTDGAGTAAFPDVDGWSARDWARRAIAEHAAWLARHPDNQLGLPTAREWLDGEANRVGPATRAVAKLLTAARAGLFHASLEAGEPELPLTVAATCGRLGKLGGSEAGSVAQAALDAYCDVRTGQTPDVPPDVLGPLREVVLELPAYSAVRVEAEGARSGSGGRSRFDIG